MRSLRKLVTRVAIRVIVWANRGNRYMEHMEAEIGHWFSMGEADGWMARDCEALLAVFASQGHSGSSAPFLIKLFSTLAAFQPWGPLTGEEHEWIEISDDGLKQNRRCSRVFRDPDGRAYDIEGRVFEDGEGFRFTSKDSRTEILFPYTPTTRYIRV